MENSRLKREEASSTDTAFTEYSFKETSLFHSFGTVDNYQIREDAKGVREQYSHYMGGTDKLASWKDREFNPDDTYSLELDMLASSCEGLSNLNIFSLYHRALQYSASLQ